MDGGVISIHAPHARSDSTAPVDGIKLWISIHAPHARSDVLASSVFSAYVRFQSTLLMRGATWIETKISASQLFISIHAPHARSDPDAGGDLSNRPKNFNPRSSCEERRGGRHDAEGIRHFNPRSSCEERRVTYHLIETHTDFNPRSSCEERHNVRIHDGIYQGFQSTLLMRGATLCHILISCDDIFQSTLLMRGATVIIKNPFEPWNDFNPRSSCEERPGAFSYIVLNPLFQSTLLMRGATQGMDIRLMTDEFQSTLLMRGATSMYVASSSGVVFQSTLLMRGATCAAILAIILSTISIHAPHARSDDHILCKFVYLFQISIHAPHARSDHRLDAPTKNSSSFQSTLLMRGATRF